MRVYNFGAGPATLPEPVLLQAQAALLDWQGLGVSVIEVSHRSAEFVALLEESIALLRELLAVPAQYEIILMGAPARFHFGAVPLNFLKGTADYVVSGYWSKLAFLEAQKVGQVRLAATNEHNGSLEAPINYDYHPQAAYCYFTPNETLSGLYLKAPPQAVPGVPWVADMTSCLLTEPIDVTQYGLIFAGAQKNLAPAGLSVVIVNKNWLMENQQATLPSFFNYAVHAESHSNYATPPIFNIYIANLVLRWVKEQGGVSELASLNQQKAALLYSFLDNHSFYHCPIPCLFRSKVNITFRLADEALNDLFIKQAKAQGLVALKGHRHMGGMRASLYNAMPIKGVKKLIQFMEEFAHKRHYDFCN